MLFTLRTLLHDDQPFVSSMKTMRFTIFGLFVYKKVWDQCDLFKTHIHKKTPDVRNWCRCIMIYWISYCIVLSSQYNLLMRRLHQIWLLRSIHIKLNCTSMSGSISLTLIISASFKLHVSNFNSIYWIIPHTSSPIYSPMSVYKVKQKQNNNTLLANGISKHNLLRFGIYISP